MSGDLARKSRKWIFSLNCLLIKVVNGLLNLCSICHQVPLAQIDDNGTQLTCYKTSFESAQNAKDEKEWCRIIMIGIYGDSAKFYRGGEPRTEGLKKIADDHFKAIEGEHIFLYSM